MNDEDFATIARRLQELEFTRCRSLLNLSSSQPLPVRELHFGENQLGDVSVRALVKGLLDGNVQLQVLKLHKNRVGSAGAHAVAEFMENAVRPPNEVHLSHNFLAPSDARRLLVAAARRPEYPLDVGRKRLPLWLRLERQNPATKWDGFERSTFKRWHRMQEMLEFAEQRLSQLRQNLGLLPPGHHGKLLCVVESRKKCCSTTTCGHAHAHGPIIHLPYVWEQGTDLPKPVKTFPQDVSAAAPSGNDCGDIEEVVVLSEKTILSCQACLPIKRYGKTVKHAPDVVHDGSDVMVLNKGPQWLCSWNALGSGRWSDCGMRTRRDLHLDRRSWEEVVESGQVEHLDVYLARRYDDEMACKWWTWHRYNDGSQTGGAASAAGCIHRLDKETSGCLVRAKTQAAFDAMRQQLCKLKMTKHYICVVYGRVASGSVLTMDEKLTHDDKSHETYVDPDKGDWAETHANLLARLWHGAQPYSLCNVRIVTGRTHQIRVHFAHRGHPVVCDPKYNPMRVVQDRQWCSRLFLHAHQLSFIENGEKQEVVARLSDDLCEALGKMKLEEDCSAGELYRLTGISFNSEEQLPMPRFVTVRGAAADQRVSPVAVPDVDAELVAIGNQLQDEIVSALEAVVDESGICEASLATLVKHNNIRWRLRRLECGGDEAHGFAERLAAFAQEHPSLLSVDNSAGILRLRRLRSPWATDAGKAAVHELARAEAGEARPPPPPPPPPG